MLDENALASDVGPHFGNVPVGLGKMAANHRSKDTGIPDCEKSKPRLGRCTSAKRSYGAGRPVCVVEVEARASGMTVTPNVGAAACVSSNWRTLEALSGLKRKATRETVGIASLRICNRLAPTS